MRHKLARLARMDARELSWRSRSVGRALLQRGWCALRPPTWNRRALLHALAPKPSLRAVRDALRAGRWDDAHAGLSDHIARRPSTFVIAPADRPSVVDRIRRTFRAAGADAAGRADRILRGEYDLLGYRGLVFRDPHDPSVPCGPSFPRDGRDLCDPSLPDWHYDPVHDRRAPRSYWTQVPFLNPACGDHKIIWELNRHQHWLVLGRAYWLTGDRAFRDRCLLELERWLDANPPLVGINWASMLELAFRSLSWTWALYFFATADASDHDSSPWTVDLLLALDRQLTHVECNLSYYFSPNTHLLGEALALYVTGRSLPELAASTRRADIGRRILVEELSRQIASDGGHCERSTHYHRYALDFYAMALAVARITRDPVAAIFERAVFRLASAARVLCDDWARAPHLGDDDGGALLPIAGRPVDDWTDSLATAALLTGRDDLKIGRPPEETLWLLNHPVFRDAVEGATQPSSTANAPPVFRSAALEETGYYVSRSAAGEHLVLDGGPHGYQNGGHAHADALAATMSIRGIPLLIDPGTACYTIDARMRDRFRSTALHNTLIVDGHPQSVPSSPFHWTRTTDAIAHRWRTTNAFDYFDGSHDGYAPAVHRRRVLAVHGDLIIVADHVDDPTRSSRAASVHWHVHPDWAFDVGNRMVTFRSRHERVALVIPHGRLDSFVADSGSGLGWHSPSYGRVEAAATITVSHTATAPFWLISVFDLNPLDAVEDVTFLPLWAEAGTIAHGTGIRISHRGSTDFVLFAEPTPVATRPTWRVAEFETDARMLFCSLSAAGNLTRLAIVDGSTVRGTGRRAVGITLGHAVPALYIDESTIRKYTPCAASPAL